MTERRRWRFKRVPKKEMKRHCCCRRYWKSAEFSLLSGAGPFQSRNSRILYCLFLLCIALLRSKWSVGFTFSLLPARCLAYWKIDHPCYASGVVLSDISHEINHTDKDTGEEKRDRHVADVIQGLIANMSIVLLFCVEEEEEVYIKHLVPIGYITGRTTQREATLSELAHRLFFLLLPLLHFCRRLRKCTRSLFSKTPVTLGRTEREATIEIVDFSRARDCFSLSLFSVVDPIKEKPDNRIGR